eukprot:COSAG01_NODE_3159_length_6488_cov_8.505400_5_plen_627_part_00
MCCNVMSHYMVNATLSAIQATCAACVAHECADEAHFEEALHHLVTFLAAHAEALLTFLAALPIAGRLSDHFLARVRRRLCPKRKVVVMSCPEMGTLRLDGAGPYDQEVMEKVAELQRRKVLKMGFDRAGSSTKAPEDDGLDWSDPQDIKRSRWMYGFRTAAKKVMAVECQSFDGIVVVVCIFGGPITRVEHEVMGSIIEEAKRDAAQSYIDCRIERSDLSYAQFVREYDEGWLWRGLCCWVPRCARGLLRDCARCRLPDCCSVLCDRRRADSSTPLALDLLPTPAASSSASAMGEGGGGSQGSSGADAMASQQAEAELSLKHPVGQPVWVRDVANEWRTPWISGRVEGHDPASGKPLVRAVEGRAKEVTYDKEPERWSAAECAEPREWAHLRTAAPGFTNVVLSYSGSSWAAARDGGGLSPRQAAGRAALTLFGWHLLQPALYFYVFVGAFSGLDTAQQVLGSLVGVREGAYALSVLACVAVNPAFLLVDVGATVRDEDGAEAPEGGYGWLAMYAVAPEKFVVFALTGKGGLDKEAIGVVWAALISPLLDLCGMAALGAGLGAGHLPPPLAVGYSITTAGALLVAGFFLYEGIAENEIVLIAVGLGALVCCVLPAFLVPLLVLANV